MREGREGGNRIEGEPGCPWATIVAEGSEDWAKWEARGEGKEGNFLFVFLFLFLGRRASAFGELGRRQGKQVVRWETRLGKREGRGLTTKMLAFPPLAGD